VCSALWLTFSLALEHLEQLLDALVARGQRLLLRLDARLQLLGETDREWDRDDGAAIT
jgi:hypothetical protein